MFKLYRKSQEAQLNWMRNHPVQYVALNVTVFAVVLAVVKYLDRRDQRKFEIEYAQQEA